MIARDMVVTVAVEVWDLHGNLLETAGAPVAYLHGGYEDVFPAIEAALEGRGPGDAVEVTLEPDEAFGEYDESLVLLEPRDAFPAELEVGMQFEGLPSGAGSDDLIYTVTDIAEESVVVDGNHPLAGIALKFVCRVQDVRAATALEIEQGYCEDPGGGLLRVLH